MQFYKYVEFTKKLISNARSGNYNLNSIPEEYKDRFTRLLDIIRDNNLSFDRVLGIVTTLCPDNSNYADFFNKCVSRY